MEDALRGQQPDRSRLCGHVLILVLMEDALRGHTCPLKWMRTAVLILVLMEDALRVMRNPKNGNLFFSLNPCSNGRCSARLMSFND